MSKNWDRYSKGDKVMNSVEDMRINQTAQLVDSLYLFIYYKTRTHIVHIK